MKEIFEWLGEDVSNWQELEHNALYHMSPKEGVIYTAHPDTKEKIQKCVSDNQYALNPSVLNYAERKYLDRFPSYLFVEVNGKLMRLNWDSFLGELVLVDASFPLKDIYSTQTGVYYLYPLGVNL